MPSKTTGRRTQEERSEATQQRILNAAVDCLIKDGYAGATTIRIAETAGVSRGAMLHHFPTRAVLLSQAVEHLASERLAQIERDARGIRDDETRTAAALDILWGSFSGRLFQAALELWVAARTDGDLREALVPVERTIGQRIVETARELFDPEISSNAEFETLLMVALNAMRGIAAVQSYEPQTVRQQRHWERTRNVLVDLIERAQSG